MFIYHLKHTGKIAHVVNCLTVKFGKIFEYDINNEKSSIYIPRSLTYRLPKSGLQFLRSGARSHLKTDGSTGL